MLAGEGIGDEYELLANARERGLLAFLVSDPQRCVREWESLDLLEPEPMAAAALGHLHLFRDEPALAYVLLMDAYRAYPEARFIVLDLADAASRMGRVEVYQRIGSSARNIPTPEGPHTHVLPGLLKTGRTHSANIPIPAGHRPVLLLYPPSPVSDAMGEAKPFDRGDFDAFQRLLDGFGRRGYVAEKRRITEAVLGDVDAGAYRPARSRMGRTGARIALRQMIHTHGAPRQLRAWRNVYDRVSEAPDPHGH